MGNWGRRKSGSTSALNVFQITKMGEENKIDSDGFLRALEALLQVPSNSLSVRDLFVLFSEF